MTSGAISSAHSLFARFKCLWWLKAAGTIAFMSLFFALYFHVQKSPRFPVTHIPLTWLDRAIPMQAWGWIPYLSLWLYTSLPPALQPNFRSLAYYGVCISALCGTGVAEPEFPVGCHHRVFDAGNQAARCVGRRGRHRARWRRRTHIDVRHALSKPHIPRYLL